MIAKEPRLLRVGVLGCGPIAQFAHFDACRKGRNTELYAICDAAPDLLERMAAVHRPAKTYAKFDDMMNDPDVEAVIVATSDQFHVSLCVQALSAGKHVFVEKPLGVSVEECEALRASFHAIRAKDHRVFQVGNNRRFDPGVRFAHQFIQEEIGGLIAMKSWYCDSTQRYAMTDNLQPIPITSANAVRPGGNPKADKRKYFMLTHGSHLVDSARFLAGEIEAVTAKLVEKYDSYCWFVSADFKGGHVGHFDLTIPIRGDFQEGFQIYGEFGSVYGKIPLPWYHKSGDVECFSVKDRQFRRVLGEDAYTYKLQLEAFADSILHGRAQVGATVDDGTAAMRAMVAIARSVESGASVRLDQVTGSV
ncbi:MAG: Gfo/Idh/MocA family oxidoreductase [Candidatus Hydrogenedentes bacterium]|nr:Gfo/Idh/MocA family oxidoreductase [Candidatus Hydrogenedentota bacterium]